MNRVRRVGAATATLAVMLTACGGGGDDFSVQNSLDRLPDPGGEVAVVVGDVDTALEVIGRDRSADGPMIAAQLSNSFEGEDARAYLHLPHQPPIMQPPAAEELGWGYDEVGWFAAATGIDGGPPVVVGGFAAAEGTDLAVVGRDVGDRPVGLR